MKTKDPMSIAKVGEVVTFYSDNQNKEKWIFDIFKEVFQDQIIPFEQF